MIVIDTNILAYLLIDGDRTAACRDLLAMDPEWCAPVLWRSEFRNVLTTHMRHAGMPLNGALARMREAERLIAGHDYTVSSDLILALTDRKSIAAYDAEFVCLATELNTHLVTTDKKLLNTFSPITVTPENFRDTQNDSESGSF